MDADTVYSFPLMLCQARCRRQRRQRHWRVWTPQQKKHATRWGLRLTILTTQLRLENSCKKLKVFHNFCGFLKSSLWDVCWNLSFPPHPFSVDPFTLRQCEGPPRQERSPWSRWRRSAFFFELPTTSMGNWQALKAQKIDSRCWFSFFKWIYLGSLLVFGGVYLRL